MKILLDMNLPPSWIPLLETEGYEAKHWGNIGSQSAPDIEIMEWARKNDFIVFTHDLDFGALLFSTQATAPSVIQLRSEDVRPSSMGEVLLQALETSKQQLAQGAIVTVNPRKNRIHLLPLKGKKD